MPEKITLPCSNGFTLHTDGENIVIATKKSEEVVPISRIQSFSLRNPALPMGKLCSPPHRLPPQVSMLVLG